MSKKINIPIYNIKPANEILDILTGEADICIVNPWFDIPGVNKPEFNSFLQIVNIGTDKTRKGIKINSPQIAYKCGTEFRTNITFTEDRGENACTTRLRFYPMYSVKLEEYDKSFKAVQKLTATRGTMKKENTGIINECIINYQLAQAFELCLLCKMLSVKEFSKSDYATTLTGIIDLIKDEFKDVNESNYKNLIEEVDKNLAEYLDFVTKKENGNDERYMILCNSKKKEDMTDDDVKNDDLFKAIYKLLSYKYKKVMAKIKEKKDDNVDKNYYDYNKILSGFKYKPFQGACYPIAYKTEKTDGESIEGISIYTNYTFNNSEKNSTKHRSAATKGKLVRMLPKDHAEIAGKTIDAKIYLHIDFDLRSYDIASTKDKSPTTLRYIVEGIQYKISTGGSSEVDIDETIDVGMDSETTEDVKFIEDDIQV